jgi:ubiquinone/menaquinone biosynthesis C-methylase UbiE
VVGCGTGEEAAILGEVLNGEVIGIDIEGRFNPDLAGTPWLTLIRQDATSLPWNGASFHLVYSYHALEHIPDFHAALAEMARVLTPGGLMVIGTPNRKRLVGYLGSKSGTSWRKKLAANLRDWKYKLRGRFYNQYGAHAGFSAHELQKALRKSFSAVRDITLDYYQIIYSQKKTLMKIITRLGLDTFFFPSVYFLAQ